MSPLPRTIDWVGGPEGHVVLIDQTKLPGELRSIICRDLDSIWEAIRSLRVRGAPAIGVAAAMGTVLGVRGFPGSDREGLLTALDSSCDKLEQARPTAVNLAWACRRMRRVARASTIHDVATLKTRLLEEALRIRDEDIAMCRSIGRHGEFLVASGAGVLTHCNAGALAAVERGTALAPLYAAHEMGRLFRVFADETRPLLQGSRLTAWELRQAGIDVTVLCDNMAATLMHSGQVSLVLTGADRITRRGDVANKVGTYGLAILARHHGIPFYVAAPSSTFDLNLERGEDIPIEYRSPDEIRSGFGAITAPSEIPCYSPAFDVTPAEFVTGIIFEGGVMTPVNDRSIAAALNSAGGCPDT